MPSFVDAAVLIGASVVQTFGLRVGAEQPQYVLLEKAGAVEIRRYEPRIAAETIIQGDPITARNDGFRRIAGYIFGGNQKRADISMTSPVAQSRSQEIAMTSPVAQAPFHGGWKVQFYMPSKYAMADLPIPLDPSVRLVKLPTQTFAVVKFTGSRNATAVDRKSDELIGALAAMGQAPVGKPVAWFYDPPWTLPFVRRNEVAVELASPLG
jgi:hypothetical protein